MFYLLLFSLIEQLWSCSLECNSNHGMVCVQDHLTHLNLERTVMEKVVHRFTTCHYDELTKQAYKVNFGEPMLPSDRPSIAVTIVECDGPANWKERSIGNRRRWNYSGCTVDISLLVVLNNGLLRAFLMQTPPRRIRTDLNFEVKLRSNYTLSSLAGLLDELTLDMESHPRSAPYQEQEHHMPIQDAKEHWPNWAIYVVIICFLLTLFAFLLGNCITKRAAPLRFKSSNSKQPAPPRTDARRQWGAGFSGGLWAAA